ncbi:MAG: hypothetical protein KC443_16740, partial [Anaerolineales bacterium]|nr:hypothetical protein [Anaerolineales bacterium]
MASSNGQTKRRFDPKIGIEEQERRDREAKIKDMLPNEEDDELLGKAYDDRLVRRLLQGMSPYRRQMILAIIWMIISSILGVIQPTIVGLAVDNGIRANAPSVLRTWTIVFAVTAIGEWITNRWRISIMAFVGTKVVADFRSKLFRHLHTLTLNFHNNYSVGRLMSRLISDVGVLQDFVTWSITGLFRSFFTLIGIIIAMLVLNWQLALVTFA